MNLDGPLLVGRPWTDLSKIQPLERLIDAPEGFTPDHPDVEGMITGAATVAAGALRMASIFELIFTASGR